MSEARGPSIGGLFAGDFFAAVRSRMAWAAERQSLIARNIANASTPDFLPSDMKAQGFDAFLRAREAQEGASQSGLRGGFGARPKAIETAADGETTPNGNGVNLERQMMKAAETTIEFQQAASLYRKALSMWRTAVSGRGI